MDIERRALYNSLRLNWLNNQNLIVEPWQVEDYRALPLNQIFERLKLQDIFLDKNSFLSFAEEFDTPEELTEHLLSDVEADKNTQDQIYLLLFELWRRLVPEKTCLTIFCDDLDHQIDLYDGGKVESSEPIQDALSNLQAILDENTDQGIDPRDAFDRISHACANDLESFLYDFIAEQIDAGDISYAEELLEDFSPYVIDTKWFEFLRARLLAITDQAASERLIHKLIHEATKKPELEFNLEVLSFMVILGEKEDFIKLVKKTIPLLKNEEDFQDLLSICADFYHRLDFDNVEVSIQEILRKRSQKPLKMAFLTSDPDVADLFKTLI